MSNAHVWGLGVSTSIPLRWGLSRLTIYWIGTIYTAVFDDLAMNFERADVDNLANQISAT